MLVRPPGASRAHSGMVRGNGHKRKAEDWQAGPAQPNTAPPAWLTRDSSGEELENIEHQFQSQFEAVQEALFDLTVRETDVNKTIASVLVIRRRLLAVFEKSVGAEAAQSAAVVDLIDGAANAAKGKGKGKAQPPAVLQAQPKAKSKSDTKGKGDAKGKPAVVPARIPAAVSGLPSAKAAPSKPSNVPRGGGAPDSMAAEDVETKKLILVGLMYKALESSGGTLAMNALCENAAIQNAKRGVVSKMSSLIEQYPHVFGIDKANPSCQQVNLVGPLPAEVAETVIGVAQRLHPQAAAPNAKKQKLDDNNSQMLTHEQREEFKAHLFDRILQIIEESPDGYATSKDIGDDEQVKAIRQHIPKNLKLKAFIESHESLAMSEVPGRCAQSGYGQEPEQTGSYRVHIAG